MNVPAQTIVPAAEGWYVKLRHEKGVKIDRCAIIAWRVFHEERCSPDEEYGGIEALLVECYSDVHVKDLEAVDSANGFDTVFGIFHAVWAPEPEHEE